MEKERCLINEKCCERVMIFTDIMTADESIGIRL